MGYTKLSQQPQADEIKMTDSILGVFNGELGKASVEQWLEKIDSAFDIRVVADTNEEYILSITVGQNTVVTPNLRTTTLTGTEIKLGHLYLYMSDGTTFDAGVVDSSSIKKYGFCMDLNSSSPKLTRIGDARYLVAEPNTGDEHNRNDFDFIYPLSDMKRCTLSVDGIVTSYQGEPGYTEDGSLGEVMVQIPKYYRQVYVSEATGKVYRWFSEEKLNDYYQVPKRFLDKNGNELDYIYVAAFLLSTDDEDEIPYSRSGNYYYEKSRFAEMQEICRSRGTNWHMMDVWDYDVLKDLWLLEWATLDSQSVYYGNTDSTTTPHTAYADIDVLMGEYEDEEETILGVSFISYVDVFNIGDEIKFNPAINGTLGVLDRETNAVRKIVSITPLTDEDYADEYCEYGFDGPYVEMEQQFIVERNSGRCGITNSIKASSGQLTGAKSKQPFVWRGIENLYGEVYTWLDGMLLYDSKYYVQHDPSKYSTNIYDYIEDPDDPEEEIEFISYTQLSYAPPSSTGYISKMQYDEATGLTMPTEVLGASDKYYCDYFTKVRSTSTFSPARFGGSSGEQSGLFSLFCNYHANNNRYAARLSYSHYE